MTETAEIKKEKEAVFLGVRIAGLVGAISSAGTCAALAFLVVLPMFIGPIARSPYYWLGVAMFIASAVSATRFLRWAITGEKRGWRVPTLLMTAVALGLLLYVLA